jgi:FkbM family methyltransferase
LFDLKIIVDAFGGDNAPLEIMKGCAMAVKELDVDIMLTGKEDVIRKVAKENDISLERMQIIDAPDVITMEDSASDVMKAKSKCSMAEGLRRLAAGEGDAFISVEALDNLLLDEPVTFIKMDIEGAETQAIIGTADIIKTQKPKMAICVYHRLEDIINIPFLLKELVPEYKIFLRHYSDTLLDTVCYAVL